MADGGVELTKPLMDPTDFAASRREGDSGIDGSGAYSHLASIAAQVERNLSHESLHTSSDHSLGQCHEVGGQGLAAAHRITGSQTSLQGLDPTHDQTMEAPPRLASTSTREAAGRTPGVPIAPARQTSGDDIFATALGGLDLSDRDSRAAGGSVGLRRPGSYGSLSHGTGLHADDGMDPEIRPRSVVIQNLIETVSDEDLQQDLESYGDVQTLYTGTKAQGKVMVTFFDCVSAGKALAALNGRSVNGRDLRVDFHVSQKDAQSGRVFLFNMDDAIPDQEIKAQMGRYGLVMFVRRHPAVPFCREVYFNDVRAAQRAYNAVYPHSGGVPTISENGSELGQQPTSMRLRNAQSSQALHSYQQGPAPALPEAENDWIRPRSWDNSVQPADLSRMMAQGGQGRNSEMLALLNQTPTDTLDHLVRSGYLPNNGSSNSLQGLGQGGPSSAALRGFDSHPGSTASLAGLNGMTSSTSHPDLTGPYLPSQNDSPTHPGPVPLGGSQHLLGSGSMTPEQVVALQNSRLLSSLDQAGISNRRRGMSSPDLQSLGQGSAGLLGLQGTGGRGWNVGGQYNPSELSGWGSNLGSSLPPPNIDSAALLAAQGSLNLGSLGALQRSMSALQLQQLQQQQQQQLLLQLAGVNPQALAQLSNLRLNTGSGNPGGTLSRGKAHRSDDNLAGGRLSRRAADPAVEAERKAQQERHFALDEGKVERGEDVRTTLMIKNIPNKYTQKMLLQTIDEQFGRMYDFFYLPIDFKNKCNVGYAFINLVKPLYILPFTKRFNQRKWERFNSEKVCHISYARIQGKSQLVTHFQNSSLLHEDKRCRPILFRSDGELASDQEPFPTAGAGARGHRPRPYSAGNQENP